MAEVPARLAVILLLRRPGSGPWRLMSRGRLHRGPSCCLICLAEHLIVRR